MSHQFEKRLARSLSFCIVQLREGEGDARQDEENPGHVQREPLQEAPELQRGADPQVWKVRMGIGIPYASLVYYRSGFVFTTNFLYFTG